MAGRSPILRISAFQCLLAIFLTVLIPFLYLHEACGHRYSSHDIFDISTQISKPRRECAVCQALHLGMHYAIFVTLFAGLGYDIPQAAEPHRHTWAHICYTKNRIPRSPPNSSA